MAIRPGTVYPGETVSGDPAYPYGKARDETSVDAFDGTPWQETFVNDLFGFLQRCLVKGDVTPNDTPDTGSFSQYLAALEGIMTRRIRQFALVNHVARTPAAFVGTFRGVLGYTVNAVGIHFLVFGDAAEIQTSNDGITWTKRTPGSGATANLNCGCMSGIPAFVLAGDSAEIQTSNDGITWTRQTPGGGPFSGSFQAAAARSDATMPRYLLAGTTGEIETSNDAITWTKRTPAGGYTGSFGAACFFAAAGLWVLGGTTGEIQTSPDGITWTKQTQAGAYAGAWSACAANGKRCVLVGSGGELQTSEDGITWTKRTTNTTQFLFDVHFGLSFICVGNTGTILESLDGITWTNLSRSHDVTAYGGVAGQLVDGVTLIVGPGGLIRQSLLNWFF